MVEGGASVIGSFLSEASQSDKRRSVIDIIIVTVAPTFVGDGGIGYGAGLRTEQVISCIPTRPRIYVLIIHPCCSDSQAAAYSNGGHRPRYSGCSQATSVNLRTLKRVHVQSY
jgi:hypothetical protein